MIKRRVQTNALKQIKMGRIQTKRTEKMVGRGTMMTEVLDSIVINVNDILPAQYFKTLHRTNEETVFCSVLRFFNSPERQSVL